MTNPQLHAMNARHLADTLRALADNWMTKGEKIGWNLEAAAHNMAVKDCGDTLDDLLIEYAAEAQPTDVMLAGRLENMATDFRRNLGRDDGAEVFIHRAEVDTLAAAAAALRSCARGEGVSDAMRPM